MAELPNHDVERLISRAVAARHQAYAPHSHFYVGAAILVSGGEIIEGCNVENASYGLSLCAERVAAASAVTAGFRTWSAIAIASLGGVTPCGACRQFLVEFGSDLVVILVDVIDGTHRQVRLASLLPQAFDASKLPGA